jgi:hypothetical protein
MADATIATFDAKYTYSFWRPVTAIRAADTDGNPATDLDPTWTPLIVTPAHPEYPSAHSIISPHISQTFRCGVKRRARVSFPQAINQPSFPDADY